MRFKPVSRVFSKDDLYTCAEIISSEAHIPLKDLIRSLEHFFSESGEEVVRVVYSVPVEGEDLPDYESTKIMLEKSLEGMKYQVTVDDIRQEYISWCRESWHTHHKEGKPCKAKIKPQYWHRIRSFCVRNNYH